MGSVCPHLGCPDYECYEKATYDRMFGDKMPTVWFQNDGSGIALSEDDTGLIMVGDYIPDWVRVPAESPIRPGDKLKVLGYELKDCPKCKRSRPVRHLKLEDDFRVAECKPGCGFVFYRVSVNTKGR